MAGSVHYLSVEGASGARKGASVGFITPPPFIADAPDGACARGFLRI